MISTWSDEPRLRECRLFRGRLFGDGSGRRRPAAAAGLPAGGVVSRRVVEERPREVVDLRVSNCLLTYSLERLQ